MPSYSVNKVILMGNLGADPEIRYTPSGQPRCTMRIATSYRYLDKQKNEWQERTSWHRVVAWGKQGELCKQYLSKGRKVFVEGRIDNHAYTSKDGQQKYSNEVITDSVIFLDAKRDGAAATRQPTDSSPEPPEPPVTVDDSDVPF